MLKMKIMKYTGYACAAALLLFSSACSSDDPVVVTPPENPGEEVAFSAAPIVDGSRTIYDEEGADGIKINWLAGDIVAIASPQAEAGFQQSLYSVNIESGAESQNYASSLEKTGEAGIRWGEQAANFYSVYSPSPSITISGSSATGHANVPNIQRNYLPNGFQPASSGVTFPMIPDKETMQGQVMWAQAANQNTNPVKLQYHPCSTTLYMTFDGYTKATNISASEGNSLMIESITLTAPAGTNIAGDFDINFNADATTAPTFSAGSDGSNSVTVTTDYATATGEEGRLLSITPGQSFSIKMILNPVVANNIAINEGWTIAINVRNGGSYTSPVNIAQGTNTTLKAGMIHKMHFSSFTLGESGLWKWTPDSWMAQIPRNTYVSELSIPGAWYAWDGERGSKSEGYQTSTIADLFAAGIRAFQVETRVGVPSGQGGITPGDTPAADCGIVISGTGSNGSIAYYGATALTELIDKIQTQMSNRPEEFAVLAINYSDGGSSSMTDGYKAYWLNKLQSALSRYPNLVYANQISPSTTVGEVLGKLIVLINIDTEAENANVSTWPNSLLVYTDMSWEASNINNSLISPMTWASWPTIPTANVDIATTSQEANKGNLFLNYTLANRTYVSTTNQTTQNSSFNRARNVTLSFDAPSEGAELATLAIRKASINTIVSNSDKVYAGDKHNVWYYIGAGGTLAHQKSGDSQKLGTYVVAGGSLANDMTYKTSETIFTWTNTIKVASGIEGLNTFLLKLIQQKIADNKPSPVGLVFFNQCADAKFDGPALIKQIFDMNNEFSPKADESKPAWPNGKPATGKASFSTTVDFVTEPAIK